MSEDALVELLENSFALWQKREQGQPGWNRAALSRDLQAMISAQLVDREPNGNLTLTALGRYAGESSLEVRSVTQIASALRGAPQDLSLADLIVLAQVTVELDGLRLPCNRKSHKEQERWPEELARFGAAHGLIRMLHVAGGEPVLRAKRAAACLLFVSRQPFADIEAYLLQHVRERSAAGPIRQVAARTRDVIDAVAHIVEFHDRKLPGDWDSADIGVQLELGLSPELVEVGQRFGNILSRGEYLALLQAGLTTVDKLSVTLDTLDSIVGNAAAQRIGLALTNRA